MKKLISLLMIACMGLTLLTSCAKKVELSSDDAVTLSYQYDGVSVNSALGGTNAALVINNLNGLKITKEAPEGANYVEGVYFMVGDESYHIDLNGSSVMMIGDKEGYVELEQYRYEAVISLFNQFGIILDFDK